MLPPQRTFPLWVHKAWYGNWPGWAFFFPIFGIMLWKYSSTVAFISIVSVVVNVTSKVVLLVLVMSVIESKKKWLVFDYYK